MPGWVLAYWSACLPACLDAWLPGWVLAYWSACLPACLPAWMPGWVLAYWSASLFVLLFFCFVIRVCGSGRGMHGLPGFKGNMADDILQHQRPIPWDLSPMPTPPTSTPLPPCCSCRHLTPPPHTHPCCRGRSCRHLQLPDRPRYAALQQGHAHPRRDARADRYSQPLQPQQGRRSKLGRRQ